MKVYYRIELVRAGWPARYKARVQSRIDGSNHWYQEWKRYGRTRDAAIKRAQKTVTKLRKAEEREQVIARVYPE